ncbi:STAS/SEC14 domain-containing protein, partial [candidate division WWE3 bacterium]|nr:STAS/SEC14 domain-containing protein [candidate division WWE3 bacterium]
ELKFDGKLARVLIDASAVTDVDSGARSAALKSFKSSGFEKMAIVVENNILHMLIKVSLKVTERTDHSRIFKSKEDALQWLLQ